MLASLTHIVTRCVVTAVYRSVDLRPKRHCMEAFLKAGVVHMEVRAKIKCGTLEVR